MLALQATGAKCCVSSKSLWGLNKWRLLFRALLVPPMSAKNLCAKVEERRRKNRFGFEKRSSRPEDRGRNRRRVVGEEKKANDRCE